MNRILAITLLCFSAMAINAKTIYVKENATGGNNGNNWNNAYKQLSAALAAAKSGDNIWVAAGTYTPGNSSTDYFNMKNGVSLYGGFAGTETALTERNVYTNKSILSGEIGTAAETDNCNLIVRVNKLSTPITISGFVITKGYSTGFIGAGMEIASSSPVIALCTFIDNKAMGNFASGGAVTITGFDGESKPQFLNCIFRNNFSNELGGAVHSNDNNDNQTIFANCLFDGNQSDRGGAIHNGSGVVATFNCTFVNNKADKGTTSYSSSGTLTQHINAISWDGNTKPIQTTKSTVQVLVNYSIIQGGYAGTDNLSSDPKFISSTNFQLQATSPARDKGDPSIDPKNLPAIDLAGNNRVTFGRLDIGAYEYKCVVSGATITETTCDAYTSTSGKKYTESGSYEEKYETKDGCDSIVTLNLTITKTKNTITETSCLEFTLNGKTYSKSGKYEQSLKTTKGCDSILTIDLTIKDVNAGISQSGNTLSANNANATSYQWVDCDNNNAPISGETGKTYTATKDGNYAVLVTEDGCEKMSRCISLTPSFIGEGELKSFAIYPQPANNRVIIETGLKKSAAFVILDITGSQVSSGFLLNGKNEVDLTALQSGIYMLQVEGQVFQLVKE